MWHSMAFLSCIETEMLKWLNDQPLVAPSDLYITFSLIHCVSELNVQYSQNAHVFVCIPFYSFALCSVCIWGHRPSSECMNAGQLSHDFVVPIPSVSNNKQMRIIRNMVKDQ